MDKIYTLTVINCKEDVIKDQRTCGWFKTFEEADEIVIDNQGDIFEVYYNYAVIEEYQPGFYFSAPQIQWYFADFDKRKDGRPNDPIVSKIDCPEKWKQICNWAMG
jgi:hypothetical protein